MPVHVSSFLLPKNLVSSRPAVGTSSERFLLQLGRVVTQVCVEQFKRKYPIRKPLGFPCKMV